jgi:hypothetical protein
MTYKLAIADIAGASWKSGKYFATSRSPDPNVYFCGDEIYTSSAPSHKCKDI